MKAILSIDPVKIPLTGIGRYTYELAKGLKGVGLTSLQFLRGGQLLSDVAIGKMRSVPYGVAASSIGYVGSG